MIFERILARIGIRPNERRLVRRFFWLHFALIASYTLARAVRDAVFLGEMSARRLPYLYIAVALFTALIAAAMGRFTNRQYLQRWLSQILLASGVVLLGFAALLHFVDGSWPPIAFYLWTGAYGLIHISLFWVLANEAIDSSEAKRLFGIIGAGGILGGLAGGALVSFAGWALRPVDLTFVAAGILFAAAPLPTRLLHPTSSRMLPIVVEEAADRPRLLQHRYVRLLALLFFLAGMTSAVLDFRFKVVLQTATAAQPEAIARYLGYYYVALNFAALALQIVVSRPILRRLGASNVAMLLPAGVVAGAVAGSLAPGSALLVAGTRLYDAVMRISLARTSYQFFFYPLPAALRRRAKAWIDVFVDRAAEAVAGLVILGFYAVLRGTPSERLLMTLILALAWLLVSFMLRRSYGRQLATSLRSLVSDPERKTAAIPEAQLIAEAHRLIASAFEKRALFAFELLESIDPQGLDARLESLLQHQVPAVRARALARIAASNRTTDDETPLLRRATRDQSAMVRTEALRLYAGHNEDAEARLRSLLGSSDVAERAAAIEHLAARPGLLSETEIDAYVARGTSAERRAVAAGIARHSSKSPAPDALLRLLEDADLDVRRQAIDTCGALGRRELIPALLPHLARPATAAATRLALAAYGNRVVGTLGDWMRDPHVTTSIRWRIPAVLASIGTQEAADELMRLDGGGDAGAGYRVLKAMNRIHERNPAVTFDQMMVRSRLGREVAAFARFEVHLAVWRLEPPSRANDLLVTSLEQRLDYALNRVFRRLGLIYAQREMRVGYRAVVGGSRRTRAQAVEFLETVLLAEDRRVLQPLLEDDPSRRAASAAAASQVRVVDRATSLHDLVHGDDAWLQSCALFAIGFDRRREHVALVAGAVVLRHPLAIETAAWSRRRLESA